MIAGLVPVGIILPWAKSLASTPSLATQGRTEYVEAAGATLSDAQSVYNTAAVPALNNNNRFLRGQATSGGTGGTDSAHQHSITAACAACTGSSPFAFSTSTQNTGTTDGRPAFYNVVYIIRVK